MGNGFKIEVPNDYFARTAAREYADDAGLAVVREFVQNACDAGATEVSLTFAPDGIVICRDNGKGCDADKLRTKVLRPLESAKDGDNAVGGFGKAKELLYFSNPSWSIQTRDVYVEGSYLDVTTFKEGCERVEGFIAIVKFPVALAEKAAAQARKFFAASERPGVKWVLNDEQVACEIERPRRATKDFGFCKAYLTRDCSDTRVYYRTGGLLTGSRYAWHGSDVGRVVLELTGASVDLLTPARDNFRSFDHREQVDGWLNRLVTDARRELADEVGDEIVFFDDGELDVPVAVPPAPEDLTPADAGTTRTVPTMPSIPMTGGIAAEVSFLAAAPVAGGVVTSDAPAAKPKSKQGFDLTLMPRIPGVGKVTVHTGGKDRAKEGAKWLKANKRSAARLLAGWATSVRRCAAASRLPVDAVGFTFSKDALAEFVRSNGRFALLVNPLSFDVSNRHAVEEIVDLTVHELAHEATRGGHDEAWAAMEHVIRRECRGVEIRGAVARAFRDGTVALAADADDDE